MKLAGCELGDIKDMVRARGLEETLRALREAGVYIAFEEFKGRTPVVRGGHVIPVNAHDFDNPYLSHYYQSESGGTTGAGTRVDTDLNHLWAMSTHCLLIYQAHGVYGVPTAVWFGVLPDSTGINNMLRGAVIGQLPQKWFTPITNQDIQSALKYRLATQLTIRMGRLHGVPIPRPEPVRLDQAGIIARWAVETVKAHGACLIRTSVSKAIRICLAAREAGLDLKGTTILGGGEPPTPGKVQAITRAGAHWVPTYFFNETGAVGMGCTRPADINDIHFFKDVLALIQYPRTVPGSSLTVEAFHFTSLLPTAPKLMLNVESDDYGVIERRACGCPLEAIGFTEHLRDIRSFRKLTGEGVTLIGSEMVHILEEVLPARFGGSPLDYQLIEEEIEDGFTRLSIIVSPEIRIADENAVIQTVLDALGRRGPSADLARALWSQANTLRVKRMEPVWTAKGKLMPLHLMRLGHHSSKQG
jgi:hypothetical protein